MVSTLGMKLDLARFIVGQFIAGQFMTGSICHGSIHRGSLGATGKPVLLKSQDSGCVIYLQIGANWGKKNCQPFFFNTLRHLNSQISW
jgi:hypothetical protein